MDILKSEKDNKKEISDDDDGELPEEGEIMDDEEEKNKQQQQKDEIKEQKQLKELNLEQNKQIEKELSLSPNRSSLQQFEGKQQINSSGGGGSREFQRGGGGASNSWRKSFGYGRGGRFSRGGSDNVRYRDFDGRVAMKNNDQQEEEMLDSWNACVRGGVHHHQNNYRRGGGGGGGRLNLISGDISPIRTSPMIEENEEEKKDNKELLKKQTEISQHQIDDDKDFRAIDDSANKNTIDNKNSPLQHKNSPNQQFSDDNDFRRSSTQQSNFNRQTPPPFSEGQQSFEGNNSRRRHRSQSPPVNLSSRSHFPNESEEFDNSYGNSAKRYRSFYESGDGQRDENFERSPPHDENGPWFPRSNRSGDEGDFNNQFNYGGDRGGRGGRTQGWGYRGGRPFFPRLICKFFREGFCRDGDQCTFSHLTGDSHRRPELCRYYQQGYCKKGLFCQLMHGEWPCKAFHKGECSKEQCSFSHEPLDDVSRPIMDKILEEEKLGLTNPSPQQHPRFDTPQQQTPHFSGIRPFFRPRFQGPYQNQQSQQPGGQNFSQSHTQPMPQQHFHRNMVPPPPPQQQPFFKHPQQQSFDEVFVAGHGTTDISEETEGISQQQQPSIPPPGLVMPPPLGGGSPLPLPSNSSSTTFGFFNPVSSTATGHQSSQQLQTPSFQQLQQQVQQAAGPHFPHQPSLLGPSSAAAQAQAMLTAILQQSQQNQIRSTPSNGNVEPLQQSPPPPPPPPEKKIEEMIVENQSLSGKKETSEDDLKAGGFNINQMLEQITRQNSPPSKSTSSISSNIKREETNTLNLLSKTTIEESPASPVFINEKQEGNENKPAALIPVVREWKLHLVDLSPLFECSDMHFDIKQVQQISSSNSDPRLRKIAEKQFDLVSRTLEQQQQANQQKINFNDDLISSENFNDKQFIKTEQIQKECDEREFNEHCEVLDPRMKDPRRRKDISSETLIEDNKRITTTSSEEAELVKKQMAALEAAAKQQNFEQSSQMFGTPIRHQIGLPQPINFQMPPPTFLPGNPISNAFFNVPPPPFSLQQQVPHNFPTPPPSAYQQQQQVTPMSHHKLEAQTFSNEQLACSSSMDFSKSSSSFEKLQSEPSHFSSSYQYSGGYRGRRGRYSHHHNQQQHYNNREHNNPQNRRSESPPKQPQQQQEQTSSSTISLREKRKNNEYESPLARMASNSRY